MTKKLDYKKVDIFLCEETPDFRCLSCSKEPETIEWIESWVKPGDIFFDIGANIGAYSFVAEKCLAVVYAFEPAIPNFYLLCKNIILNESTINPIPLMVSRRTGLSKFAYSSFDFGSANHNKNGWIFTHDIASITMEDFCWQTGIYPNHVKIDVDGHEIFILEKMIFAPPLQTMQIEVPVKSNQIIPGFKKMKETIRQDPTVKNVLFIRE